MRYVTEYDSPLGRILLTANEKALTGLYFQTGKYLPNLTDDGFARKSNSVTELAKKWLHAYFSGKEPDFTVPVYYKDTPFRMAVWNILSEIPYGQTMTYKEIAEILAKNSKTGKMSARAVGAAVGRNPVSIIIPCHRVIGSDNSLTGYAGGIDKKIQLLKLERIL